MEEIKIPDDLLNEFSSGSFDQSENGSPGMAGTAAIMTLEKSLAWLINVGDQFAKERDLPGVGKMSNDQLAELTAVVLERNLGASFMENSPEFMLGTIGTGIIASNMIAYQKQQKENEDEQEND